MNSASRQVVKKQVVQNQVVKLSSRQVFKSLSCQCVQLWQFSVQMFFFVMERDVAGGNFEDMLMGIWICVCVKS